MESKNIKLKELFFEHFPEIRDIDFKFVLYKIQKNGQPIYSSFDSIIKNIDKVFEDIKSLKIITSRIKEETHTTYKISASNDENNYEFIIKDYGKSKI